MNLGGMLFGFAAIVLVAGMIVFVGASQSTQVVDSNGNTSTAQGNATSGLVGNITAVGGTATGYTVLIIAALCIIVALGFVVVYSKSKR